MKRPPVEVLGLEPVSIPSTCAWLRAHSAHSFDVFGCPYHRLLGSADAKTITALQLWLLANDTRRLCSSIAPHRAFVFFSQGLG